MTSSCGERCLSFPPSKFMVVRTFCTKRFFSCLGFPFLDFFFHHCVTFFFFSPLPTCLLIIVSHSLSLSLSSPTTHTHHTPPSLVSGVAGLYDYGPPGCAVMQNIQALWRQHFVRGFIRLCILVSCILLFLVSCILFFLVSCILFIYAC